MKSQIFIPSLMLGFYSGIKKDADIDLDESMVTTVINQETGATRKQRFYTAKKFEFYQMVKYGIPLLLFVTSDLSIGLKNAISIVFAAILVYLWHKYRLYTPPANIEIVEEDSLREKLGKAFRLHKRAGILIFAFMVVAIVGIFTGTAWYSRSIIEMSMYFVAVYEIFFGVISKEYLGIQKVYVDGLSMAFPKYFIKEPTNEDLKRKYDAHRVISKKMIFVVPVILAIGLSGILYSIYGAYNDYQVKTTNEKEAVAQEKALKLKTLAEQNGSAQIIIEYVRIKEKPEIEALNARMGIEPTYSVKKSVTCPWENGFRQAGVWTFKDGKLISTQKAEQ